MVLTFWKNPELIPKKMQMKELTLHTRYQLGVIVSNEVISAFGEEKL